MRRVLLALALLTSTALAEEVVLPQGVKGELRPLKEETVKVGVYELELRRGRLREKFRVYRIGQLYFAEPTAMVKKGKFLLPVPAGRIKTETVPLSPADLSRLKEAYSDFISSAGLKEKWSSKPVLFVVSDPLCPYCERAVRSGELERLREHYDVRFVPLPVHGQASRFITACLVRKAEEEGRSLEEVAAEWFRKSPEEREELLKSCGQENLTKEELLLSRLSKKLEALKLTATPTFIYPDGRVAVGKLEESNGSKGKAEENEGRGR